MHLLPTLPTVPSQPIQARRWPWKFKDNSHRVLKPYGVVGNIWWQEEQFAFVDVDVTEFVGLRYDCLQEHAAFVLVEELGCFVNVVVCAGVRSADDLDGQRVVVDEMVVNGWFE